MTTDPVDITKIIMMTSSNGNILRVIGHLCGEFTGPRWITRTKASDAELWCFFYLRLNKRLSKQSLGRWFETLLHPLWRHCKYRVEQWTDRWNVSKKHPTCPKLTLYRPTVENMGTHFFDDWDKLRDVKYCLTRFCWLRNTRYLNKTRSIGVFC